MKTKLNATIDTDVMILLDKVHEETMIPKSSYVNSILRKHFAENLEVL